MQSLARLMHNVVGRVIPTAAAAAVHGGAVASWRCFSTPSNQDVRAAYEHCAQLVNTENLPHKGMRYADVTNLIAQLRAGVTTNELRLKVLALRAFNLETLLIGEHVKSKEPLVTQIRFQWWRDAVSALTHKSPPPGHPILTALWDAQYGSSSSNGSGSSSSKMGKYQLKRILDAREQDVLHHQTPLTVQELEAYAENTASQLLYLQLAAAGVVSRDADHAASHLGKAIGISLLLRGAPYQASKRRSYMPIELCSQHKVSQEDVYRGNVTEGLRDVTLAVAAAAMGHLTEARHLAGKLPKEALQVMQQGVLAGHYLKALEKAGFNVFDPSLTGGGVSPLQRVLSLKWNMMRGTL